jgi:hypothetical protein
MKYNELTIVIGIIVLFLVLYIYTSKLPEDEFKKVEDWYFGKDIDKSIFTKWYWGFDRWYTDVFHYNPEYRPIWKTAKKRVKNVVVNTSN